MMSVQMLLRRIGQAAVAIALAGTVTGNAAAADWRVDDAVSPLNGSTSVSASLASAQPLINMIGVAQPATLVLRCTDRVLAAYVVWPQVLSIGSTGELFGTTQTLVVWRIDNNPIAANYWDRSNDGTAAGKFSTGGALKILRRLGSAQTLVVRMTGQITQDAVFALGDVDPIIARVEQACGASGKGER